METTIVQIIIRGEGAGLAAAQMADDLLDLHYVGHLMRPEIEMEEGAISTANLTVEISTVAPQH